MAKHGKITLESFIPGKGMQPVQQANLPRIKGGLASESGSDADIESNEERTRGTGG